MKGTQEGFLSRSIQSFLNVSVSRSPFEKLVPAGRQTFAGTRNERLHFADARNCVYLPIRPILAHQG